MKKSEKEKNKTKYGAHAWMLVKFTHEVDMQAFNVQAVT